VLRDAGQLMAVESGASDWARGLRGCLTWGIPVAILVITPERCLVIVWPATLTFMGVACLLNARRCGRIHCYATGPFFLLLAVFGLLYGIGLLPLGDRGWTKLSTALVIGSVVLICVPEWQGIAVCTDVHQRMAALGRISDRQFNDRCWREQVTSRRRAWAPIAAVRGLKFEVRYR
jgi:hypothetical protein